MTPAEPQLRFGAASSGLRWALASMWALTACGSGAAGELQDADTGGPPSFFVASRGVGRGADLGGLEGADAQCAALAEAASIGADRWRAYLSTSQTANAPAVHARDRIGGGPWHNVEGVRVAADLDALHAGAPELTKASALTELGDPVPGRGDTPNQHDILTGSTAQGLAFDDGMDHSCANWTSSDAGAARLGHSDRVGGGDDPTSWNSAHDSLGCSIDALRQSGGDGRIYCFRL